MQLDFSNMTFRKKIKLVVLLSVPAILAQISSVIMQYIDAAMVGSLGANASASIGLMSSTTWLTGGFCICVATGFSVQVAHLIGGKKYEEARNVLRQSLVFGVIFGMIISLIGCLLSDNLPYLLGGNKDIVQDARNYFVVYSMALIGTELRLIGSNMLQCSGDMKSPSMLNILMCILDVILNYFLIFPTRKIQVLGAEFNIIGAGLGVTGAALGTAIAECVTAVLMLWCVCVRSNSLRLFEFGKKGIDNNIEYEVYLKHENINRKAQNENIKLVKKSWRLRKDCLKKAALIAIPMSVERVIMNGAQITSTRIIAPLGTVAVAANSLAITAESLCYMPGFGVAAAATTLVGQSIGAGKKDLAKSFGKITVFMGAFIMGIMGVFMYFFAPWMFEVLTPDAKVQKLGIEVLRIVAFAETFFGMSIVTAGALRGAGDTVIPSILNLVSMWGVRITLTILLVRKYNLVGVWVAMAIELTVRGIIFLIRLLQGKWLKNLCN